MEWVGYGRGVNPNGPWWIPVTMTMAGVMITLLVNVWLDSRRGRREVAARLSEYGRETAFRWAERKLELYSTHMGHCHSLADLPVWPSAAGAEPVDPGELVANLSRGADRLGYLAPPAVREATGRTVDAARELAGTITAIRRETRRGHDGGVAVAARPRWEEARAAFVSAVAGFASASRADLDIATEQTVTDR